MLLSTNESSKQHVGTSTSLLFMLIKLGKFYIVPWLILGICKNANETLFIWGWVIFWYANTLWYGDFHYHDYLPLWEGSWITIPCNSSLHRRCNFCCSRSSWFHNCIQIPCCSSYPNNVPVSLAISGNYLIFCKSLWSVLMKQITNVVLDSS